METTRLSSKGQIIIPKSIRDRFGWQAGQEFAVESTADGIRLVPSRPFPETHLDDVAGCLAYDGPPVTLEEMEAAIETGIHARHDRR